MKLENLLIENKKNLPNKVKLDMLNAFGIRESELENEYNLISVSITDLYKYGTISGERNNKPFNSDAIKLLNSLGVSIVYLIVDIEDDSICSMAFNLDFDSNINRIEKFSRVIKNNGGSLSPDTSLKNWTVFESD